MMGLSNAERQRRYIQRLKAKAARASHATLDDDHSGEIATLRKELQQAKTRILQQQHELKRYQGRQGSKPKAEKAPLPPDEARDRQIKSLKTANQNLRAQLRASEEHYRDAIVRSGGMTREARNAIDKVLHPDQRGNASEADKDEACKRWNAWKTDNERARRRR
jgi:hypothetical protein